VNEQWRPALSLAQTLEGIGVGNLCKLDAGREKQYGREVPLGTRRGDGTLGLAPWLKRILKKPRLDPAALQAEVLDRLPRTHRRKAHGAHSARGTSSWHGSASRTTACRRGSMKMACLCSILRSGAICLCPCRGCPELPWCSSVEITASPAHAWRQLGLTEPEGQPTRRGIIFCFFHHGEGLAVAAALEDESYPKLKSWSSISQNLRAGPRFAGDDSPYGGRLGVRCQRTYGRGDFPGYLSLGVPSDYGAGAR
jgi:hypothetical protein